MPGPCRHRAGSANLRREESRRHAGEDYQRGESVEIRNADAAANPGILELCHSMGNVMGVLPSTLKS